MAKCCGNCEYGHYDRMQGHVCVNDESEYVADFVDDKMVCDFWRRSGMLKMIKRLFCKHKYTVHLRAELVKQSDGSWITSHVWKCKDCGKEL